MGVGSRMGAGGGVMWAGWWLQEVVCQHSTSHCRKERVTRTPAPLNPASRVPCSPRALDPAWATPPLQSGKGHLHLGVQTGCRSSPQTRPPSASPLGSGQPALQGLRPSPGKRSCPALPSPGTAVCSLPAKPAAPTSPRAHLLHTHNPPRHPAWTEAGATPGSSCIGSPHTPPTPYSSQVLSPELKTTFQRLSTSHRVKDPGIVPAVSPTLLSTHPRSTPLQHPPPGSCSRVSHTATSGTLHLLFLWPGVFPCLPRAPLSRGASMAFPRPPFPKPLFPAFLPTSHHLTVLRAAPRATRGQPVYGWAPAARQCQGHSST